MGKLESYECDGQMSIFDLMAEKPKPKNVVKVGEVIYFVGYRAWRENGDGKERTLSSVYKLRVVETYENGDFLARLDNYEIVLNDSEYKKSFFYFRDEAIQYYADVFYNKLPDKYDNVLKQRKAV